MDAVIMDGSTLSTGAVACITSARHPVSVARAVMEQTEHCLVVGAGADRLVERLGCEPATQSWLTTDAAQAEHEYFKSYSGVVKGNFSEGALSEKRRTEGLVRLSIGFLLVFDFFPPMLVCFTRTGA